MRLKKGSVDPVERCEWVGLFFLALVALLALLAVLFGNEFPKRT